MEVVWEANIAGSSSRKRASKACDECQRRKRRCHHTIERLSSHSVKKFADGIGTNLQRSEGQDAIHSGERSPEPIRAGDFHPDSILTDLSTGSTDGVLERLARKSANLAPLDAGVGSSPIINRRAKSWELKMLKKRRRPMSDHQRMFLEEAGAFRILPRTTRDLLLTTYVSCLDGLIPILDGRKTLRDYYSGQASELLIQAICLVACKTEQATPYLQIVEDGPLLEPLSFAKILYDGLDAAIRAELEPDRFTNIQILALMHLHNDGQGGFEEASAHLSQAIHEAWVLNMQFYLPGRTALEQSTLLWWTLWGLDRVNAILQSSPLMIADRDIDLPRPPIDSEYKHQIMAIWLKLGDILDNVIEIYRPNSDPSLIGWEDGFPAWSDVCLGVNVNALQMSHRDYLEIWYHATAILSCRSSPPGTKSYQRRLASADMIQEMTSGSRHHSLPPLPIVPYAVSLSLTSAYRAIRDSQKDPNVAYQDLVTRCETLESLSRRWSSAGKMAKLGRKALSKLKAPSAEPETPNEANAERRVRFASSYQDNGRRTLTDVNRAATTLPEIERLSRFVDMDSSNPNGSMNNTPSMTMGDYEQATQREQAKSASQSGAINQSNNDQLIDLDHIFGDLFDFGLPAMNPDAVFLGISPSSIGSHEISYGNLVGEGHDQNLH